jgi:hypothetical protein
MPVFGEDVVASICSYMNTNQADNNLLIVQILGKERDATAAKMIGFDEHAVLFGATILDGELEVRLPWNYQLTERAEIQQQLLAMVDKAMAAYEGS